MDEPGDRVLGLYLAALTLFVVHSLDSVRFAEWRLFRMTPVAYLLAYVPLTAILVWGVVALERRFRAGYELAILLGLIDIAALAVHAPQVLRGPEFQNLFSVAFIVAMPLVGVALVVSSLRVLIESSKRRKSTFESRPV